MLKYRVFFLQISLELATEYFLIKEKGLRAIIATRSQISLTDEELLQAFWKNEIKTKTFEQLKELMQEYSNDFSTSKDELTIIDIFQLYRNKIMHLNYNFEQDLFDIKYEFIYLIVHVLIPLLNDEEYEVTPSEFYEYCLNKDEFLKLINFPTYVEKMESLAREESRYVYKCLECHHETFSVNDELCYCCNFQMPLQDFGDCILCGSEKSVVFDNLNIEINNNIMRGLCLNCDKYMLVFKCPQCGNIYTFVAKDQNITCEFCS